MSSIPINLIPSFLRTASAEAQKQTGKRKRFRLNPGVTVQASDRSYTVGTNGAYVRNERKPWRNKAERKRHIKARREGTV